MDQAGYAGHVFEHVRRVYKERFYWSLLEYQEKQHPQVAFGRLQLLSFAQAIRHVPVNGRYL